MPAGLINIIPISLAVRHFGMFTGVGIMAAMAFSLTFLPAMLSLLSPTVSRGLRKQVGQSGDSAVTGWAATFLSYLGRGVARRPLVVWVPAALVVAICLFGAHELWSMQRLSVCLTRSTR